MVMAETSSALVLRHWEVSLVPQLHTHCLKALGLEVLAFTNRVI